MKKVLLIAAAMFCQTIWAASATSTQTSASGCPSSQLLAHYLKTMPTYSHAIGFLQDDLTNSREDVMFEISIKSIMEIDPRWSGCGITWEAMLVFPPSVGIHTRYSASDTDFFQTKRSTIMPWATTARWVIDLKRKRSPRGTPIYRQLKYFRFTESYGYVGVRVYYPNSSDLPAHAGRYGADYDGWHWHRVDFRISTGK